MYHEKPIRAKIRRLEWRMERTISVEVPVDVRAPHEVRRQLQILGGDLEPEVYDTVSLIVTEAVSNAARRRTAVAEHERVGLVLTVSPELVRGEVRDGRLGFDVAIDEFRHNGVGDSLYVIDHLSSAWGLEFTEGARLWFEVRRRPGDAGEPHG
jgi:hypothetical protein